MQVCVYNPSSRILCGSLDLYIGSILKYAFKRLNGLTSEKREFTKRVKYTVQNRNLHKSSRDTLCPSYAAR